MNLGVNGRFYGARVTGVQRFAREVTSRLAGRSDVTLFLPRAVEPEPSYGAARVVSGKLGGHAWEHVELPGRARAAGCNVILHLSNTAPTWGGPHVVTVYDVTPITNPEWYTRRFAWWFRTMLGRATRRAAYVLALSEWARAEIGRVLRVGAERIGVVTQGLEPFNRPAPAHVVDEVRARWKLDNDFVLAVGAGGRKNLGFLERVMDRWGEVGDAPTLVVVGEAYAQIHGRPDHSHNGRARYVGYVSDKELQGLYTAASVFCFPSHSEGFGRPPLEAMACGTPAVVADYGCAREVLGDAAHILPLDVDAWVTVLDTLVQERETRARIIRRGLEWTARYRWETAVEQIVTACEAVVDGRRGRI